jgi:hypothetical protein
MNVYHVTPSTDGVEIVKLISLYVDEKNHLSLIEKDGAEYMTGGIMVPITPRIKVVLDCIPKEEHHEFLRDIRNTPLSNDSKPLRHLPLKPWDESVKLYANK